MLEHRDAFRGIFSLFTIGLYFVGLGINPDAAKTAMMENLCFFQSAT